MKVKPTTILLTLVGLVCQPGDAPVRQSGTEVRDSAGVRIIENLRPPEGSRLGWRIGPEPTVSIGVRDGDEPYMFYFPSSFFRFPDGRIVVANRGTEEVRMFDGFGTHLTTFGGEGPGPAEFLSLMDVAPWPGDSILAWDSRDYGISIFDADGNYGRTFSAVLGDDTGHLWVREYDYPQEEGMSPIWTVFDPNGRVLGYVETPEGLRIQHIGKDYVMGRIEDELGVEYVQVWPLERSDG